MPKISVIVPVYNTEKYLNRCVDSILNQTFTNLECILVDDGSPDRSGRICDEYAKKDKRIKVIHKPNGGLSDARNAALDIATGDYIGFVDSDDWIHPQMYEILYYAMQDTDAGFVSCKTEGESEVRRIEQINLRDIKYDTYEKDCIMESFYNKFSGMVIGVCTKLYKRDIFEGLRFKKGIIYEDDEICIPTILKAGKVTIIDKGLYYYNTSSLSINRSPFNAARFVALDIAEFKNSFFEKGGKQYSIGHVYYYEKYVAFSIVVNLCNKKYRNSLKKSFCRYKNKVNRDIIKILNTKCLCKMMKFMILCTLFSNRLALCIAKKYFRHVYDVAIYDIDSLK